MAKIKLADLQPGMVLAGDAVLLDGRVLLRSGAELTEKHLRTFKAWGLLEADIVGISEAAVNAAAAERLDPQILQHVETSLRSHFRHNDLSDVAVAELFRVCVLRAAAREMTARGLGGDGVHS